MQTIKMKQITTEKSKRRLARRLMELRDVLASNDAAARAARLEPLRVENVYIPITTKDIMAKEEIEIVHLRPVPKEITIKYKHPSTSETVTKQVLTADYIPAKIKQLGEFGYPGLTEKNIRDQLFALRNGRRFGEGLDAIGMMMKDEVIFDLV